MPVTAFGFVPDVVAVPSHCSSAINDDSESLKGVAAPAPEARVRAYPVSDAPAGCKIVHFMRHGEGTHNAAAARYGREAYASWEHLDARLTEVGRAQATGCRGYAQALGCTTVIVSPLSRAIETAVLAFGPPPKLQGRPQEEDEAPPGPRRPAAKRQCPKAPAAARKRGPREGNSEESEGERPHKRARQKGEPDRPPARPPGSAGGGPIPGPQVPPDPPAAASPIPLARRFVAVEACREKVGQNPCDGRRSVRKLVADFGAHVDFSALETDADALWTPVREEEESMAARGRQLLTRIAGMPDTELAVVCHSSFLLNLFNKVLRCSDPRLATWFATCELRSVALLFPPAAP